MAVTPGCLEIEPVAYTQHRSDAGTVAVVEGGAPGDSAVIRPCRACVEDPGGACFSMYQTCETDPKCKAASVCAIDKGCLNITELQARIDCAVPCIQSAGILGNTDPALGLALNVNLCAVNHCVVECGGKL